MDPTGVPPPLRHRRSPSSDRFLDVFSFSPPNAGNFSDADEFNEEEVFFTNDFTDPHLRRSPSAAADRLRHQHHARRASFPHPPNPGILDALPETTERRSQSQPSRDPPVFYRKPSISPTPAKSIPRPPASMDFSQSAPARKFQQSAPMKIPVLSQRIRDTAVVDDEIEDEQMLPPHEMVARSPKTTYSVLEGAGRTLKGRDLRQVRNAIWRQTGFLD